MVNTSKEGRYNPKIREELDKADWQEISLSSCSLDSCEFLCIWFSLCESVPSPLINRLPQKFAKVW